MLNFLLQVPPENLISAFMEVQNSTKTQNLEAENVRAYNVQSKCLSLTKFDIYAISVK